MRHTLLTQLVCVINVILGVPVGSAREHNPEACGAVALRKSCMTSGGADVKTCAYPIAAGARALFMAYEYDAFVKHLVVYRIGGYKAKDFRLDADCKMHNYLDSDLKPLLGGFEKLCSVNRNFDRFIKTVPVHTKDLKVLAGDPQLPNGITADKPVLLRSVTAENGDYSVLAVAMPGMYQGLDVAGLEITVGHSNGITAVSIIFAEKFEKVAHKFRNVWSNKTKTKEGLEGDTVSYKLERQGDFTAATCDWSN